jgi:hypothetical protein
MATPEELKRRKDLKKAARVRLKEVDEEATKRRKIKEVEETLDFGHWRREARLKAERLAAEAKEKSR